MYNRRVDNTEHDEEGKEEARKVLRDMERKLCEACCHEMSDKILEHRPYVGSVSKCDECKVMDGGNIVLHLVKMKEK